MQEKTIVTIPALNEEKTICNIIRKIKDEGYDVLVVDDGSTDNTVRLARNAGAVVYRHHRNFGLAKTFQTEVEQCLKMGADIIIHIDADGQYNPHDIYYLERLIKKGYDLALGSRFLGTIEKMSWIKKIGNKMFSKAVSWIIKMKITDSQTGFRAFNKKIAEKIKITSNFTYTQEQIIKASRENFRIIEIPTIFYKRDGHSRLMRNPLDYALKGGINLLKIFRDYEPLRFFGMIALCFLLPGLIIGSRLTFWYLTKGHIYNRIPSAIVCLMLILLGVQILLFGFLADMRR